MVFPVKKKNTKKISEHGILLYKKISEHSISSDKKIGKKLEHSISSDKKNRKKLVKLRWYSFYRKKK